MNISLVPPPHISDDPDNPFPLYPPLGLMSIAAIATKAGHYVKIVDINWAKKDGILHNKKNWHYFAAELILKDNPEIIGFGTLCSSFPATVLICKAIKIIDKSIPIILGGPQASSVPKKILESINQVDFILRGESDFTFTEFIDQLSKQKTINSVKGISFRMKGGVVCNNETDIVDINQIPFTDYSFWPICDAIKRGFYKERIQIEAGRGCPFNCIFCSTSIFFSRKFRIKTPERLVSELTYLYDKLKVSNFSFTHDLFTANKKKVIEICRKLKHVNIHNFSWGCSARIDKIDNDILIAMKESGCVGIFYGVEVSSERMQKIINKNIKISSIEEVLLNTLSNKINFNLSLIIGFPQENLDDIEKTLTTALKWSGIKKVSPQIHILAPQVGTKIMSDYEDTLSFDGRFPDRAYFNNRCSCEEIDFAKKNLHLCPQVGFFPNKDVDRNLLIIIYELTSLLLGIMPGLGKLITLLDISIIDLFKKWIEKCVLSGLEKPSQTGYFTGANLKDYGYLYIDELLKLISSIYEKKDAKPILPLVLYWRKVVEIIVANNESKDRSFSKIDFQKEIDTSLVPIITDKINLFSLDYDVEKTIINWNLNGNWEWPEKRKEKINFLLVFKNDALYIEKITRITYILIKSCGKLTLEQMIFLIDSLCDDESILLKKKNNSDEILVYFLQFLVDIGLSIDFKEIKEDNLSEEQGKIPSASCTARTTAPPLPTI